MNLSSEPRDATAPTGRYPSRGVAIPKWSGAGLVLEAPPAWPICRTVAIEIPNIPVPSRTVPRKRAWSGTLQASEGAISRVVQNARPEIDRNLVHSLAPRRNGSQRIGVA